MYRQRSSPEFLAATVFISQASRSWELLKTDDRSVFTGAYIQMSADEWKMENKKLAKLVQNANPAGDLRCAALNFQLC